MSSRSRTKALTALALLPAVLAGCSEHVFERRDGVSIVSGEAVAANRLVHMIDPWPPASANRNIAFNGEKMAVAHERYRTGRIIPPVNPTTSSAAYQGSATTPPPMPPASPSAPVK